MKTKFLLGIQFRILHFLLISIILNHILDNWPNDLTGIKLFLLLFINSFNFLHTLAFYTHRNMLWIRVFMILLERQLLIYILFFKFNRNFYFFIFLNFLTVVFIPFSPILFGQRLFFKPFTFYIQNVRIVWTIELIMSKLRFVLAIIITISDLVEIIHVELSNKRLIPVMPEVFR